MSIQQELTLFLNQQGIQSVGFAHLEQEDINLLKQCNMDFGDCSYGISIAVKLSDAIIDEITDAPTHTYFHHYRTVNTFIDQTLLKLGIYLEQKGYRYITVGASQSINLNGWNYNGRYSHKRLACLAGLGTIGKSSLFLHKEYGARVRLGSLFTNCPVSFQNHAPVSICKDCTLCTNACPSGAISGKEWHIGITREEIFSAETCSQYMKKQFQHIGRGAVCGICMKVCPQYQKRLHTPEKYDKI